MKDKTLLLFALLAAVAVGFFANDYFCAKVTVEKKVEIVADPDARIRQAEIEALKHERAELVAALLEWRRHDEEMQKLIVELQALKRTEPVKPASPCPAVGERVELPADAENWFATLFVQADYLARPNEAAAARMFDEKSWAREIAAKMHFKLVTIDKANPEYFKRPCPNCQPFVPATPCLLIQRPNGEIVYREVNPDLAKCAAGLKHQIHKTMKRQKHRNDCPGPYCPVNPIKEPEKPKPVVPSEVVIKPEPAAPAKPEANGLPAIVAGLGSAGLTSLVRKGLKMHAARTGS